MGTVWMQPFVLNKSASFVFVGYTINLLFSTTPTRDFLIASGQLLTSSQIYTSWPQMRLFPRLQGGVTAN